MLRDSTSHGVRRLLAVGAALLMAGVAGACVEAEPSDEHWDLVVRELRPRTTGVDTSGGVDRPLRGFPQSMNGTTLPDPVPLDPDTPVHSPLTSDQLREGAALQAEAIEAGDAEGAWKVFDGFRSCLDSVGSGYGHQALGYALMFDPAGETVAVALVSVDAGAYDSFDDWAVTLTTDCHRLYADDYLAWLDQAVDKPAALDLCAGDALPDLWADDLLAAIFDPAESALSLRCTASSALLIAKR